MGKIAPADIDKIRQNVPIKDVIDNHVSLRKAGINSYKGLCPFHDERTPSFNVDIARNYFHCFGCGESGDVIDFTQKIEGEGFRWAVQSLAEQFNITVNLNDDSDDLPRSRRERLHEAIDYANKAYAALLRKDPEAQPARELLARRGFDLEEAITTFGCGYASNTRSITELLKSKGFTAEEIIDAGLAVERYGKLRDYFHGRLTWRITNSFGKPVGFGARKLRDDDPIPGKFINTAETQLYKKSQVLYGFHDARKDIAKTGRVYIVEGYTDVMAAHLAGRTNTVAACGTAFTKDHMNILRRITGDTGEFVFTFDDDTAGHKAAQAVYRDHNATIRRLSALPVTGGLDPDEYRQTHGDNALYKHFGETMPLAQAIIGMLLDTAPTDTPENRVVALDTVLPYLSNITDTLIRNEYATHVAHRLNFDPTEVKNRLTPTKTTTQKPEPETTPKKGKHWAERGVLEALVQDREIATHYLDTDDIDDLLNAPASQTVLALLITALNTPNPNNRIWPLHVQDTCTTDDEKHLITLLATNPAPATGTALNTYVDDLLNRLRTRHQAQETQRLRTLVQSGTPEEKERAINQLIAQKQEQAH